jgi:hypothetical protein
MKTSRVLVAALAACSVLALSGCATAPPGQRSDTVGLSSVAIQTVTTIAVTRTISRDNASPELKQQRAQRVVAIATALQSLGDDALATLPQVTAALAPLLDKAGLTPEERLQADILVEALVKAALERVKLDASPTYATVQLVLRDVIRAASIYLEPARPG